MSTCTLSGFRSSVPRPANGTLHSRQSPLSVLSTRLTCSTESPGDGGELVEGERLFFEQFESEAFDAACDEPRPLRRLRHMFGGEKFKVAGETQEPAVVAPEAAVDQVRLFENAHRGRELAVRLRARYFRDQLRRVTSSIVVPRSAASSRSRV